MYKKILKRWLDLVFAICLIPLLMISFIILTPIIFFEDKGPIIYKTMRLGKKMKPFVMYKYRSMRINSPDIRNDDGSTFNSVDDSRMTRIGKFIRRTSIDELPQLINIIKGNMSFIGPRPDMVDQLKHYSLNNDYKKFETKPGITGYAQINGRNNNTWDEKTRLDIYYVNNISFILDIKIFFRTIIQVLTKKDINKDR